MTRPLLAALLSALLLLLVGFEVGRASGHTTSSSAPTSWTQIGTPDLTEHRHSGPYAATGGGAYGVPTSSSPAAASQPVASKRPSMSGHTISGIASWGSSWAGVVTRLPRGTAITVCGPLRCWSGHSIGFGPAVWTHRIADLSATVFVHICGPLSRGLCTVSLEVNRL